MAPEVPEGPGVGAEPQAQRRNLQRRFERPEQLPLPAAGQTLHTQGEMVSEDHHQVVFRYRRSS